MGTALDLRSFGTDAVEKLGQFASHNSAAKNDDRLWQCREIKNVVACPDIWIFDTGNRGLGDIRSGGDDEMLAFQSLAIVQLDRVVIDEFGKVSIQVILPALHGFDSIVGEFLYCIQFSLMQFLHVDSSFWNLETKFASLLS